MWQKKYLYNVGIYEEEAPKEYDFLIIMASLFMLILLEKPFQKRRSGLLFLVSYLLLIAIYVIQTTFVEMMPDGLLVMMAVVVVCPLFVRLLKFSQRT
ncbi:MAG: hypothetical protein ACQETN_06665 [Bacillota bacterium]